MKNKSKTYKFSATDVISYIQDHIEMTNNISEIVKKRSKSIDQKSIDKLAIVNDAVKNIGELIVCAKENLSIDEKTFEESKLNMLRIPEFINLIITNVLPKILLLSTLSIIVFPAILLCKIQISRIVSLITFAYKKLGLITVLKISLLSGAFENITSIVNNIIYITKELTKMGLIAWIAIPALHKSIIYIRILKTFMLAVFNAFTIKQTLRVRGLQLYFEMLNGVTDSILSITSKLIKLGIVTMLTAWAVKAASKFIIKLVMFNKLILLLFRKRDLAAMLIMEGYFNVMSNVIQSLIFVTKKLKVLGFVVRWTKRSIKHVTEYVVRIAMLSRIITTLFRKRDVITLKILGMHFNALDNIIEILISSSKNLIKLGIVSLLTKPFFKSIRLYLLMLRGFISMLENTFKIKLIKLIKIKLKIRVLKSIFNQLILLAIKSILLAAASIIAIPALLLDIVFILTLTLFIKVLQIMLRIARIKLKDILGLTVIGITLGILIVIAIEIKKLNDVASQIKWKNLFVIMGAILLVTVFSIMIGFAAMTILPIIGLATIGLLSIVIVVGLIVLVAVALQYLQSIQLDSEAVKNNVRLVLGCAKDIINMLVEDETEQPEEEKGWLSNALKSIGGAALDIISIILRFGTLAMTLLCVGMIYLIAGILSGLQNIKLDKEKILTSVQIVMDTAKMITNVLFDKNTPNENEPANDKKGVLQSLIDFVGGSLSALTGLIESIAAVPVLLMTIMSVGMIFVIANMLNKVMEVQLDSEAIRAKINSIIGVAMDISSMINGTYEDPATKPKEEEKGFFAKLGEGVKDLLVGVAKGAVSVIENLAGAGVLASVLPCILSLNTVVSLLDSVNKLKFDPANTKTKVNDIIDIAKSIGVIVSEKDGEIATVDENKVKQYGKFVDYTESYIKSINKLDVSKVKSIGDMYEKMGQFMEKLQNVPISEIADALVNKISPALSDINNNLDKNNQQATQQTQQLQQTNQQLQQANEYNSYNTYNNSTTNNSSTNNYYSQNNIQKEQQNNQPIKQIDYTSMLENIEDLLEQIKKKLNTQPQMSF